MQGQNRRLREITEFAKTAQPQRQGEQLVGSKPLKNSRHEKLAREFAAGASKADAWRAVFGREPNTGNASRTFRRLEIQDRIEFLRGEFCRQAGISLAALQARYLRIADANLVDYFEAVPPIGGANDGKIKPARLRLRDLTKLSRAATAPISELNVDTDGAVKIKIADRLHALDSLVKTIGGFTDKGDSSGGADLAQLVADSMQINVITNVPRALDEARDKSSPAAIDNRAKGEDWV
jgi:hypothetical protein